MAKRNDELVHSDVNTIRRVRTIRRLISKSSSEYSLDQEGFSYSIDGKSGISEGTARTAKSRARK